MSDRDILVEKLKMQLDVWNAELKLFEAKAQVLDARSRAQYRKFKQDVSGKIRQIEKKLDAAKDSGKEAWQEVKQEVDGAWAAVESKVQHARDIFMKQG